MLMVRHAHAQKHLQQKHRERRNGLDWVLYVFMVATPLFELPQLLAIYHTKSAENVSLTTWAFFAVSNLAWITYAVRNKLRPLTITYSLYFVIEAAIVIGILLYG